MEIQKIRFGERMVLEVRLEPGVESILVPSMLLQPLVENALQHGLEACPGPGRVSILANRAEGQLRLRVEDSGPGFSSQGNGRAGGGIGLTNTSARLEQLYGDEHKLERGNMPAGGAFVQVLLPWHPAPSRAAAP